VPHLPALEEDAELAGPARDAVDWLILVDRLGPLPEFGVNEEVAEDDDQAGALILELRKVKSVRGLSPRSERQRGVDEIG
jgi:hypothetical protein